MQIHILARALETVSAVIPDLVPGVLQQEALLLAISVLPQDAHLLPAQVLYLSTHALQRITRP